MVIPKVGYGGCAVYNNSDSPSVLCWVDTTE